MAIKKKSKSPKLQKILGISGISLVALSIGLGFYYNSRSQLCKEQQMAEKKRMDSISQAHEYFKTEKNLKDELNRLAGEGKESIPARFHNSADTSLALCIHYYTLNKRWVTAGHFIIRPGETLDFTNRTNHPEMYLSVAYLDGRAVNDMRVIINGTDYSRAAYFEKPIREKHPFMLISDMQAPYETSVSRFYQVQPDANNFIFIELANRKLGADLTAFASKYHLISPHSKKDSIFKVARKLIRRIKN